MTVTLRYKILKSGTKSAYLDFYQNGQRKYEFLDIHIHKGDPLRKEKTKLAEQIRSQRELEIYQSGFGIISPKKRNSNFIEYYEDFVNEYTGRDIRIAKYSLVKFKAYLGKDHIAIKSMTPNVCKGFADYLKNPANGLSGETPHNYFSKFRRVLREAVREKVISNNPAEDIIIKRKTNQLKKNVLSTGELHKLFSTKCDRPQIKKAFLFACYTGLGETEIKKLKAKHVQNGKLMTFRAKSNEQVNNQLHPVAMNMIDRVEGLNPEDALFDLPSRATVLKHLKRWVKRAGIKKNISFYCGRHTFATQLLIHGANLKTVADCLGHSSTAHTIKYLNYVNELKDEAIKNLPSLGIGDE